MHFYIRFIIKLNLCKNENARKKKTLSKTLLLHTYCKVILSKYLTSYKNMLNKVILTFQIYIKSKFISF